MVKTNGFERFMTSECTKTLIRSISYITISFFYKRTDVSHFLESYCIVLSANIYINSGCMQRTRTIMFKVFALVFLGRLYIAVFSLKNISGLYV